MATPTPAADSRSFPAPLLAPLPVTVAFASVLLIAGFYLLRSQQREYYYTFVREDGIAENLQALSLLGSTLVGLLIARHVLRAGHRSLSLLFAVFGVGTFLLFGEEISWGQRVFGWESTSYFQANNMQDETNLHNDHRLRNVVHPTLILIGLYATLSPLLHSMALRRGRTVLSFFTTEYPLTLLFGAFTGIYIIYQYLNELIRPYYHGFDLILWQDLEMAETFFAVGVLGWTLLKLSSAKRLLPVLAVETAPQRKSVRRRARPMQHA